MEPEMVNVYEAKTHLSRLIERAAAGEEIVIARAGKPVARLLGWKPDPVREPGVWHGRVVIASDFSEFTDQDAVDWYGER